jgi:hypothetical protein
MTNISQNRCLKVLTIPVIFVYWTMTYTTVTPLTVVRYMVEPGVPPNAGLFFSGVSTKAEL